jgi:signal transduction histidine kinase
MIFSTQIIAVTVFLVTLAILFIGYRYTSKFFNEKSIPRLIMVTPLLVIALLAFLSTTFYIEKTDRYFSRWSQKFVKNYIDEQKRESEAWTQRMVNLFNYESSLLQKNMEQELHERIALAHQSATKLYENNHKKLSSKLIKKLIVNSLSGLQWYGKKNYVWITDYDGNNILTGNIKIKGINIANYTDADGRAIILEEIQKVRKYGEGYLKTRFKKGDSEQLMYVKDFGHYGWFFGSGMHYDFEKERLKKRLLALVKKIPSHKSGFMAVYNKEGMLYLSEVAKEYLDNDLYKKFIRSPTWIELDKSRAKIHVKYFEPFDWYVVYGFDTTHLDANVREEQELLKRQVSHEITFIIAISIALAVIAAIFSLFLSQRLRRIFLNYHHKVSMRDAALKKLNFSLERRVAHEVNVHREKEKMLIQQSKMADMGTMLSMIAHQWRQPLNQLSYIFMNIEGAHEYKELTAEYLDEKITEGNALLQYMSKTIDDFRNYFKPDKGKTKHCISDVISDTLPLVEKMLTANSIEITCSFDTKKEVMLYRNELIQVLLNLIHNASDSLILHHIHNPKISIVTKEQQEYLFISVCDNGVGISDDIAEKIFQPYFSTKDANHGTGLGLYMSNSIIEEHMGGTLTFENQEEGVCFIITL